MLQENKARQIFWKTNILTPWCAHVYTCTCAHEGVRNVLFSENLTCFVFLKHPFWDSPFCLITNESYATIVIYKKFSYCCKTLHIRYLRAGSWPLGKQGKYLVLMGIMGIFSANMVNNVFAINFLFCFR